MQEDTFLHETEQGVYGVRRGDDVKRACGPIRWSITDIDARSFPAETASGEAIVIDLFEELVKLVRPLPDLEKKAREAAMDQVVERATAESSDCFEACLAAELVINEPLISLRSE